MTIHIRRGLFAIILPFVTMATLGCAVERPPGESARLMVSASQPATTSPASDSGLTGYEVDPAYEEAMDAFDRSAAARPRIIGGTVFIGSSSFTRWKTLEQDMSEFKAVNRGFGGSCTDDVLYYARRILAPLRPARIVYCCGSNDLAGKRSPESVVENFKRFVAIAREISPKVTVSFVAMNAAPVRAAFAAKFDRANKSIADWAARTPGVFFIDARPGLFDEKGNAIESLFLKDRLHLNPPGNKIWSANIAKGLLAQTTKR